MSDSKLLSVKDLTVAFETARGRIKAVDGLSFDIAAGESLGIVGESGSGKSVTSLAVMGLLPPQAIVTAESMVFQNRGQSEDLLNLSEASKRKLRGGQMAMIFQDPMTSLNPCYTVEFQVSEVIKKHHALSRHEVDQKVLALLEQVGIPDAKSRLKAFPHELSGGMSQRVMIAMAVASAPKLLIADEPTTALDVTIQAQILELLHQLREEHDMALILITHDIGVVSQYTEKLMVMYAGQAVERGATVEVMSKPSHPYTEGLLASLPRHDQGLEFRSALPSIPGMVPDLAHRPRGCQMSPRCQYVEERCRAQEPPMIQRSNRWSKCVKPLNL